MGERAVKIRRGTGRPRIERSIDPQGSLPKDARIELQHCDWSCSEAVAEDASSKAEEVEDFTRRREHEHGFGELRFYVPQDILDASFPVSVPTATAGRSMPTPNASIA